MAAAISDYSPIQYQQGKLKKDHLGQEWTLKLKQNEDILSSLDKKVCFTVGFKAETDEKYAYNNAHRMQKEKQLDAVCLNIISSTNPFGSSSNRIHLIQPQQEDRFLQGDKLSLSFELLDALSPGIN